MMATAEQTVIAVLESTNKRYVVETGQTENGWFTRYSDGWVEQGGSSVGTVTFLVDMGGTHYTALATKATNANAGNYENICCRNLTRTNMIVDYSGSSVRPSAKWVIMGYIETA